MKRMIMLLLSVTCMFLVCSCTTIKVTHGIDNEYEKMDIQYHDENFIRKKGKMVVPNGTREENLAGKLPFLIFFEQNVDKQGIGIDVLSEKEFKTLAMQFEQIISATNRLQLAQVQYVQTDKKRERDKNGVMRIAKMDYAKKLETRYFLNVVTTLERHCTQEGRQGIQKFSMTMNVSPEDAVTQAPISWFRAFQCNAEITIFTECSREGLVLSPFNPELRENCQAVRSELLKMNILQMLNHIYENFPAGGRVTEIDDENGTVTVDASEDTGLLPDLEMVVYARKKNQPKARRIPLYNGTLKSTAADGSEIHIWRKNTDNTKALKIIKMICEDFEEAQKYYDFYASSDGLGKRPDFIKSKTRVEK